MFVNVLSATFSVPYFSNPGILDENFVFDFFLLIIWSFSYLVETSGLYAYMFLWNILCVASYYYFSFKKRSFSLFAFFYYSNFPFLSNFMDIVTSAIYV